MAGIRARRSRRTGRARNGGTARPTVHVDHFVPFQEAQSLAPPVLHVECGADKVALPLGLQDGVILTLLGGVLPAPLRVEMEQVLRQLVVRGEVDVVIERVDDFLAHVW